MPQWMRIVAVALLAIASLAPPLPAVAALPDVVKGQPLPTLAPMIKKATPAVVNIATQGMVRVQENPLLRDPFFRRFFDLPPLFRERRTQSVGSGVIIDAEQGYVVTNHHVIAVAHEIVVTLRDRRQFAAQLVGTDPETDIAVLKIPAEDLTAMPMGDSDALEVGDFVVAIGNPFGIGQTVTSGIISALRRTGLGIEGFEDFIQTDASINPGNSGGALVTLDGRLIGVNTAIIGPSGGNVGIGLAIPMNMARQVIEQLITYGEVNRGRLGLHPQDLTPDLANALGLDRNEGAIITRVTPNSPAARSGLRTGDVVIAVAGEPVRSAADLRNKIGLLRVGDSIELTVLRDGETMTIRTEIVESQRLQLKGDGGVRRLAGATFAPLDESAPLFGQIEGVLVVDVERGSAAWRIGLRKDDAIVAVNRQPVRNLEDFKMAVKSGGNTLLLDIRRGKSRIYIVVR